MLEEIKPIGDLEIDDAVLLRSNLGNTSENVDVFVRLNGERLI